MLQQRISRGAVLSQVPLSSQRCLVPLTSGASVSGSLNARATLEDCLSPSTRVKAGFLLQGTSWGWRIRSSPAPSESSSYHRRSATAEAKGGTGVRGPFGTFLDSSDFPSPLAGGT